MSEMHVTTADGVSLKLVRPAPPVEGAADGRKPVLFLHGASAGSNTFTTGAYDGGVASWLANRGFDPWLLEWRGSGQLIADGENRPALEQQGHIFNFNAAAEHDVRCALDAIQNLTAAKTMAIVGFCMGSGVLAEAIARGVLTNGTAKYTVDCVVLMTLGLFYETPRDGRLKSEERILERLKGTSVPDQGRFVALNPRVLPDATKGPRLESPWPQELNRLYGDWPGRLRSHDERADAAPAGAVAHEAELRAATQMCNRLGFLYGTPYYHPNLVAAIHGTPTTEPLLSKRFGAIPLEMFIHAGRNVRRGIATVYDRSASVVTDGDLVSAAARERFHRFTKVTLISGDRNQLWHRNSIDLMYEWLHRGSGRDHVVKHVMRDYGHQDLLWGAEAGDHVYPLIAEGLTESARLPLTS